MFPSFEGKWESGLVYEIGPLSPLPRRCSQKSEYLKASTGAAVAKHILSLHDIPWKLSLEFPVVESTHFRRRPILLAKAPPVLSFS